MTEIPTGTDLSDPRKLIEECLSMADGLRQQAVATRTNTAMGGHPHPAFFFEQAAAVMGLAAARLKELLPPESPPPAAAQTTPASESPAKKK